MAAALANDRGFAQRRRCHRHRQGRDPGDGPRPPLRRPSRPGARARHPVFGAHLRAAHSNAAKRSPTRRSPSPKPPVTTPPSCGSSTTSSSRSLCRRCSSSRWPGRPTPWLEPSASVTRCCCYLAAVLARDRCRRAGDIDEMDRCHEIAGSLAEQLDQPTLNWANTFTRAVRAQIAGDTDRGRTAGHGGTPDRHRQRPTRRRRSSSAHSSPTVSCQRGTMGELDPAHRADASPTTRGSPAFVGALGHGPRRRGPHRRRGVVCWRSSRPPTSISRMDPLWLTGMVAYAEAAIECRDPKYAGPLFDRLAPWADQLVDDRRRSAEGPVSHYLGGLATVLGRYDEADAYFTQAAAFNDRANAEVLRRPHQPLVGEDARRAQRSRRHRDGPGPAHQSAHRRRGPRIRERRTTRRGCPGRHCLSDGRRSLGHVSRGDHRVRGRRSHAMCARPECGTTSGGRSDLRH